MKGALLIEAFNRALTAFMSRALLEWQYVRQVLLLQYCRRARDGVAIFFKHITTLGYQGRELLDTAVMEEVQRIREMAKEQRSQKSEGIEQGQIPAVEPATAIQLRVPQAESEDEERRKERAILDVSLYMRIALESYYN